MYEGIDDIRQEFLNFFKSKKHQLIEGSSLVPDSDHTLLFTNSGMNQFKNIFLGIEEPLFKRVVTVQRCVRAGGKHNDLDNVGYTDRHLTFFEMLGNFSFGDYFKSEAIQFSWELLTDSNWFNLSKDRIWITVHVDDDESYNIWNRQIGISKKHIIRIGNNKNSDAFNSDNFWQMSNVGPCGPCSEIFYDKGSNVQGSIPGSQKECGERYIEIWNLVFIQFNRTINGDLLLLPMLSVDTGMGLERIALVLQGVYSTYAIDIFKNLIISICQLMKIDNVSINRSIYVIADHIRACVFLIRDGVIPSNEKHGYVLRRIIRRAVLHGKKLGINNAFFYKLVIPFIKSINYMDVFLYEKKDYIEEILFNEEKLFAETVNKGLELLEKELSQLSSGDVLSGKIIFDLYNTYGFPIELTKDVCFERHIKVDQIKFDQAMLEHKKYARQKSQFYSSYNCVLSCDIKNTFIGYQRLECQSQIVGLFKDNKCVHVISVKEDGIVMLKETPFYSESGGQIGDSGILKTEFGSFKVILTKKYGQMIGHIGTMCDGVFHMGEVVTAIVDSCKRKRICLNHSTHHLLRAALFEILGKHVMQQGSLINDQQLRFDFSHYKTMTDKQIYDVESFVNKNIRNNFPVITDVMSMAQAKSCGAVMLPNKKYDYNKKLRVVSIGNFSVELCGGTHVHSTGEIGSFVITKENSVASGIRRIEGITGEIAVFWIHHQKNLIQNISHLMYSDEKNLLNKICEFKSSYYTLEKEVECLQNKQIVQQSIFLIKEIFFIKDVKILIKKFKDVKLKMLFSMIEHLKVKLISGLIVFVNYIENNRIHLIVSVTRNLVKNNRINAADIVRYIIDIFGGKGGGRSDFAQASIREVKDISVLISAINSLLCSTL